MEGLCLVALPRRSEVTNSANPSHGELLQVLDLFEEPKEASPNEIDCIQLCFCRIKEHMKIICETAKSRHLEKQHSMNVLHLYYQYLA